MSTNLPPIGSAPIPDFNWIEGHSLLYAIPIGTFSDLENQALNYSATLSSGAPETLVPKTDRRAPSAFALVI